MSGLTVGWYTVSLAGNAPDRLRRSENDVLAPVGRVDAENKSLLSVRLKLALVARVIVRSVNDVDGEVAVYYCFPFG